MDQVPADVETPTEEMPANGEATEPAASSEPEPVPTGEGEQVS
jgi:hypothetical protein